jgi:hypothetical protein
MGEQFSRGKDQQNEEQSSEGQANPVVLRVMAGF